MLHFREKRDGVFLLELKSLLLSALDSSIEHSLELTSVSEVSAHQTSLRWRRYEIL